MKQESTTIQVEITDASEFHCFRLILNSQREPGQERLEIMFHARALVDLIHQCRMALCEWQSQTTSDLIQHMTGLSEAEAREKGLIA